MERHTALTAAALALALPLVVLSLTKHAQAQSSGRCTRETLNVRGTALSVSYCVVGSQQAAPGRDLPVQVAETYSTARGSYTEQATLRFISGEESSRVIEDLALDKVGLQGTLHLTLLLRGGLVRVDSAMLTPGAVTVK